MELSVADVANAQGVSTRHVRQAVATGALAALRRVANTVVIDDLAAQAWGRSRDRGRKWTDETRSAAFEMLEHGETARLSSSERGRLKAALRAMHVEQLAHRVGGLGGAWARYRRRSTGDLRGARATGPTTPGLAGLGLVGDASQMTFWVVDSLDDFELDNDVSLDASGELGVIERQEATGQSRTLLDAFLLGGARESSLAASKLEAMLRAI